MSKTSFPLTRDGQSALDAARRIAEQNQQTTIDSLTLLLALVRSPDTQVQAILKSLNVKVDNFLARLSATIQLETRHSVAGAETNPKDINLSSESELILSESLAETEHHDLNAINGLILLLGMLRCPDSRAGQFLLQYGITAEQVRERVKITKNTPTSKKPIIALPKTLARGLRNGISPIFIALVLFTIIMAGLMWFRVGNNLQVYMFAFVIAGWIISVALHEFGHAITAFWGGDESVEHKGYLTLNPLKYTHPIISIVIPVVLLIMGGIGLPGGAVYINVYALRKPNYRSLVSAAGPMANVLFIILLSLPFDNIPFFYFFYRAPLEFLMGIAFLVFLQVTAVILNLLPIPGLDGFGIIEPFLPRETVEFTNFIRPFGFIILFSLLFIDSPISDFFWESVWSVTEFISPNLAYYANEGVKLFLRL